MKYDTQFDEIVDDRIESIRSVLSEKAKEYAMGCDRYHNFNIAARILDTTPEKALVGMWVEHIVSVLDLVEMSDRSPEKLTDAMIDKKIGYSINYLILLEGMLKARVEKIEKLAEEEIIAEIYEKEQQKTKMLLKERVEKIKKSADEEMTEILYK